MGINQFLGFLTTNKFVGMVFQDFSQMRGQYSGQINYCISRKLGSFLIFFRNPDCRQSKGRFNSIHTRNLFIHISGLHGKVVSYHQFVSGNLDALDCN